MSHPHPGHGTSGSPYDPSDQPYGASSYDPASSAYDPGPYGSPAYGSTPYGSGYGDPYDGQQFGYLQVPVQPGMSAAPAPYGYAMARTNTLSTISLVLGLVSVFLCWFAFPMSIAAVVCGHIGLKQIDTNGEQGRGMAIAGLVLGYLVTVLSVFGLVFIFAMGAFESS